MKTTPGGKVSSISELDVLKKEQIIEKVERRCLDLCQQLIQKFLLDATCQKEIAYLIVAIARKEAGIINYETDLLREYYQVPIRNRAAFAKSMTELAKECPDNSDNLEFDLVIRKYRPDGTEILPKSLQNQARNQMGLPVPN